MHVIVFIVHYHAYEKVRGDTIKHGNGRENLPGQFLVVIHTEIENKAE